MRATILALAMIFGMGVGTIQAAYPTPREWFGRVHVCLQNTHDGLMCRPCGFPFQHCIEQGK